MPELAVTAMGADRPGIVAAVAGVLHEHDGNVEDSAMTILGGHFSLVLLVSVDDDASELQQALAAATRPLGLDVSVREVQAEERPSAAATHLLSVYGSDHPGILAGIAAALAEADANITDLSSRVIGASEEPVYALVVELSTEDEETVRNAVADAAKQLGTDWTLRAIDDVTY